MLLRSFKLCTPTAGDWVRNKNRAKELLPLPLISSSRMVSAGWIYVQGSTWVRTTHAESKYSQHFFSDSGVQGQAHSLALLTDNRGFLAAAQDFWRQLFYETPGFLSNALAVLQLLQLYPEDVFGKKILTFILALYLLSFLLVIRFREFGGNLSNN